ncbi:DegT/DnrJ/EryC1/StrS family aminotransferase [Candidatus Falkowbacteria bacterium]|nr:DegT/DnrJ/EryC1/StrS family aminotransferase [Candidatus Falkowbacteria bacterium]
MKYYSIAKPYITEKDRKSVLAVLNTDNLSLGPKCREFEKKFAKKLGVKYACAVSSGTAGLHLALLACGIKEGDEVITSPFSFVASANAILYVGAKPVFVDIDPLIYNMDVAKIEEKITGKTKAILVVHIFGQPCEMEPIMKIAKKYKLRIIEDACESIGATHKGKLAGTFGSAGVFAFYPNKQMTTGEGGMIITNSKKSCALGISQLAKLDFMIKERRKIAGWYNKILKSDSSIIQTPATAANNTHTWFVYVIKIKNKKINRDRLIKNLKKLGISAKPYLPSIHLFDFYRKQFGYKLGDFPISEEMSAFSLALPIYLGLTESDCFYIIKRLKKSYD